MNASPTRRQIIGSALGLLGLGVLTRSGSIAGASASAVLHFEVRRGGPNGTPVDPVPLLGLPRSGVTVV